MPCTPMAVSAWRTSSSLKGLMMATTSFMVRSLDPFDNPATPDLLRAKSGIFLCKWHKKLADQTKNIRVGCHAEAASVYTAQVLRVNRILVFRTNHNSKP